MQNQPTKGLYTSEFATMLIKMIIGMLVMGGVVAPAHQDDLISAVTTIVGAIIVLAGGLSYILGRTWLKAKVAEGPAQPAQPTVNVNPTTVVTPTNP